MNSPKNKYPKVVKILGGVFLVFLLLFILFIWSIWIPTPKVNSDLLPSSFTRTQIGPDHYEVKNSWLKKNEFGIWEMYLEGADYERGVVYGVLAKELIESQEEVFVNQINDLVPRGVYQTFLKYFVAWFNRDIYKHIPAENLREIYGVSLSFSDKFDYIGPKFYRILNYHAAHDIGHALNDFNLVGCTSFAVNKEFSEDSSLLIARNFDFYMGDGFARDKLLMFIRPDNGYAFASYSWAGFTGVVSGMNVKGLSVTINASKSEIPFASKDPISLLAREILQYARNMDEALSVAKKRETFVSETLLIGSAENDQAMLIEKSPSRTEVYYPRSNKLICSNHYQSKAFLKDKINLESIANSDSKARYERMNELLENKSPISIQDAADILRNKEGMGGKSLGYGNPKAINQLIAHHGILFKPSQKKMWISASPFQMGEFIAYDLVSFFSKQASRNIDSLNIAPDPFLQNIEFKNFLEFRKTKHKIIMYTRMGRPLVMSEKEIETFISNNPNYYGTYMELGNYYKRRKEFDKAIVFYEQALGKEVASKQEVAIIKESLSECADAHK